MYFAPFAVLLNRGDRNDVEPDISVICGKSKLTDRGCDGAPDWIIEIVSPESQCMDYMTKLFKYRTIGVRGYWIADQQKGRIMAYDFVNDTMTEYTVRDIAKVGLYEELEIDFTKLDISTRLEAKI